MAFVDASRRAFRGVLAISFIAWLAYPETAIAAGPFDGKWAGPLKRTAGPCGPGEMKLTIADGKVTGMMTAPNRLGEETPGDVTGTVAADGSSRLQIRSRPAGAFEYNLAPQFTTAGANGELVGTFCKFAFDLKPVK